ncbi:ExeM/NucH family extracellular endonuclease [Nocardioides sp. MAH-18]|uniref:ExeM/NucH family extracellular endonuclease n=1 Tax=Nocardioides agri TaxID=2682843 RepID=A0A6L6XN48_9ACTN|nr:MULTISPECIES: ExeM/NucH family extracellular endonuclease [unclassified Nocardioides]MBA2953147.1 ExeM/NucH family extracellular endonuclease [Nocardioides sp. CGMCC 1.13656]MVQ48016.1 ExeM/NucH family extracellular endonuclease [Nocardioides sp. MAH-18]
MRAPQRLVPLAVLALAASGLLIPSAPASANPAGTGLVINEVYGAGGNNGALKNADYIELYNPTAAAIPLTGLYLHYRSAANSYGGVAALPGAKSVPPHSTFLVQASAAGANGTALPTPDHVASPALNLAAAGGQVFLTTASAQFPAGTVNGNVAGAANIVDMVAASGSSTFEGAVATVAGTTSKSISRAPGGVDTDNNAADLTLTDPSPTPATVVTTPLDATSPGDKTGIVGMSIVGFNLQASGGTPPYTWSVSGLPTGVTATNAGAVSGTPTQAGTFPVTATVTDGASGTDSVSFQMVIDQAPDITPIAEIQGDGARSPYAPATGNGSGSKVVSVEGVVTARYADGGFNGMYVQDPGADTEGASDGIFVYAGSGNNNIPAGVDVGDSVRVTGPVAEFFDLTQIVPTSASAVGELGTSLGTVEPRHIAYPTTAAGREAREGELLAPTDDFTVTNSYSTNQYAEIGLATGDTPLRQWSEYASPHDLAAINAIKDENAARAVVLDDGATTNFLQNQTTKAIPVPWLSPTNAVRVGAAVTFTGPVVLDWRNNTWKFQPTHQVTGTGAEVATFEDTRADNLAPRPVGGDLKIATFNVLNYFNTTGEAYAAAGPAQNPPLDTFCTYYTDRQSNRIGNNSCGVRLQDDPDTETNEANQNDGRGPRGAATAASLARQEEKLSHAINALDADVIGLEEVENSIKLPGETNRDDALARIVQIINNAAGEQKWAYVKSPGEALTATAVGEQDVIRPAFIYQVDKVSPVGQSDILFGTDQFANAREPLAQAFKAKGAPDSDAFAVIVNHFKSKGDNASPAPPATGDNANDDVTGVGAFNGDRTRQAARLVQFADQFAADRDIDAVFLAGDFNAYTMEDPITTLEDGGYELIDSTDADDESYSYQGLSGSLDHVLGNEAAVDMVTGADIWEINADESPAFQYSRYNYNVTNFWQPNLPFGTSDHNPEIVGIDVPEVSGTTYREIQVLGTNDFHGRLLPDGGNAAGAAPFATAVKELKSQVADSIFVAAGDLVGASTFESFIQDDEPTIDALNAMDLEVSAAGNHEFDRGYEDFAGRIQDRAQWEYIAANVDEPAGRDDLAETFTKTFGTGDDAVTVGFVGAVTEDLPALVNPAGIAGVTVTDVVDATNAAAADLKADGADLVVLLVHEGSPSTECGSPSFTDPATTWGNIVQNTSGDVDAIISGHTHLAYNCRFPVADWAGRAVTKRPVVSAGQYGTNLNQLVFKLDESTGELAAVSQDVIATAGVGYAPDPEVQGIVDAAVAYADTAGAQVLGKMTGPFRRAQYLPSSGATENRGGESTLGNQVAEVQRWATDGADIAFMNPGGLRADMLGTANGALRDLTYRQAADVQPFANTLVNMDLTGAQIETVLEQQWQRNPQGGVPSRPFLRLGVSQGFTYTYVETPETVEAPNSAPVSTFKGEVTGMWLDGEPISPTATYSVTVNSFLGGGGDNFRELANGAHKVDTGVIDLEAMVDYMAQHATDPLAVDYSQRAVEVTFPGNAPAAYLAGDTVAFDVASWAMSAPGDLQDSTIRVLLGDTELGTASVDNTVGNKPYDAWGKAAVSVQLPAGLPDGETELTLVGTQTGTRVPVTITVDDGVRDVQILATNDFHGRLLKDGANSAGAAVLSGAVKQLRAKNPDTVFAAAGDLIGASTFESFIQDDLPTIDALNEAGLEVSAAGNHEFDKGYEDLVGRVQDRAQWEYIAANIEEPAGRDDLAESWTRTFDGVKVGFVGAVTEELPSLVAPSGMAGVTVTDIVDSVNAEAARLRSQEGADLVVALVHEGSPSTTCSTMTDPATAWGAIVTGLSGDVDALVSGHTHLAYNCSFPVAAWAGRDVTERPVVSAGQYGTFLNQLVFSIDDATGEVLAKDQQVLPLLGPDPDGSGPGQPPALYPADPAVEAIVADAVDVADELGAQVLGQIEAPFTRAKFANGTTENRGGESTLGNQVAEVQRWATPDTVGAADIAFMNPGGLRTDMVGTVNGTARDLTYREAANVQPFANTLVNMDLTGAQIETVLEQQWQRTAAGAVPTRPFLRLGVSEGFTYTYTQRPDPANAGQKLGEVTAMWLDGEPIDPAASYSVTVNSFLASGGDNFRELANGTTKQDTGITDLQAMVDYLDEFGSDGKVVDVDFAQRAVDVTFPAGAPATYTPGGTVVFDLGSLSMTDPGDQRDTQVEVRSGSTVLGTFPVTTTISAPTSNGSNSNDDAGTAHVSVTLPAGTAAGATELTVVGTTTGTRVRVPIEVALAASTVTAPDVSLTYGQPRTVDVVVTPSGATGTVEVRSGSTVLGSAPVVGGHAQVVLPARSLMPGQHTLTAAYSGDSAHLPATDTFTVTVAKAASSTSAAAVEETLKVKKDAAVVRVVVLGQNDVPVTGQVRVTAPGQPPRTVTLVLGRGSVVLDPFPTTGTKTITVEYLGSDVLTPSSTTVTVNVTKSGK